MKPQMLYLLFSVNVSCHWMLNKISLYSTRKSPRQQRLVFGLLATLAHGQHRPYRNSGISFSSEIFISNTLMFFSRISFHFKTLRLKVMQCSKHFGISGTLSGFEKVDILSFMDRVKKYILTRLTVVLFAKNKVK